MWKWQVFTEKRDTQLRRAVPIEKHVEIALWRLSTGNSFRTTAKAFVFGKSTAIQITCDFCSEIQRLASTFIKFPNTRRETAKAIEKLRVFCRCHIPQALGALYGTHIPIIAPCVEGKADYYSRKQCYTISTQATVNANLAFLDVETGFRGRCHDSRNLRNTSLFRRAENREILAQPENVVENSGIRPLLLDDSAIPLSPWLIKPFQFGPALTCSEKNFNRKLSSARVTVERAFGILRAHWRYLLKRLDNIIENLSAIIITCCVLHNIC